jgi:hypothetical protein
MVQGNRSVWARFGNPSPGGKGLATDGQTEQIIRVDLSIRGPKVLSLVIG